MQGLTAFCSGYTSKNRFESLPVCLSALCRVFAAAKHSPPRCRREEITDISDIGIKLPKTYK